VGQTAPSLAAVRARRFRFWLPCALREATATMMIVGRSSDAEYAPIAE
jgi:hypothetical protein